jgi:hypothetical protein
MYQREVVAQAISALRERAKHKSELAVMCFINSIMWPISGHFEAARYATIYGLDYVDLGLQDVEASIHLAELLRSRELSRELSHHD